MKKENTYSSKIGMPPGSLVYIGEKKDQEVRILELNFAVDQYEEHTLNKVSECKSWNDPNLVTVLSVIGIHDTDIIADVGNYLSLHDLILEDIVNTQSRSKLEEFDDYLFLPMKVLGVNTVTKNIYSEHVSLLLSANGIVSFQENEIKILGPFKDRLRKGKGVIRQRKSDYIFYRLIDTFVDNYFVVAEQLAERLEALEEKILEQPEKNVSQEILEMKKDISFFKRTIYPLRESIASLIKSDSELLTDTTKNYFRDVSDHLVRLYETVESQREMVNDFMNLYMTAISNKMNEVMKVLTIFASIFIPLTFIAGIYGMNFEIMPELKWKYGYLIVWGIMLAVAFILLFYFRRKKWL